MRSVVFPLFVLTLFSSLVVHAFPEMVRMGYPNCTACHVSPNGGGLMTDYGRSISAEALSTWAYPKEELPGHGYMPEPPAWLKIGGDVRVIQTYVDNALATKRSFFLMQADLELGFNTGRFWYVQDLGIQGGPEGAPNRGDFVAHRYYGLYNLTDESYVRAGKYLMPFGLNVPDHTTVIRRNLGFDQGQESYNVDAGMIGEKWNTILTLNFGRKDETVDLEKGGSFIVGYNHGDTHKIMGSVAYLKKENVSSRILLGPQIIWGFTSQWVFLGEYDYQEKTLEGTTKTVQKGAVTYSRLQYEVKKGVNPYLLHQLSYLDFTQLRTRVNSIAGGILWYPRPHFEVLGELNYSEVAQVNTYNTVGWLLGHYYF